MKKLSLGMVGVILLWACQPAPNKNQCMHEEAARNKDSFTDVAFANSVDFICNMQLAEGISDTAHYKGKIYGFCSKGCKRDFSLHPENYLGNKESLSGAFLPSK